MRSPRQRMPTIFNLSMLDVLCCGLGAVIFLMILHSWDARRQSKALVAARERIEKTAQERDASSGALTQTKLSLMTTQQKLDATLAALTMSEAQIKRTEAELAKTRSRNSDLQAQLQSAEKNLADTLAQLTSTEGDVRRTQRALALKTEEHSAARTELGALVIDLAKERALAKAFQRDLAAANLTLRATAGQLSNVERQRTEAEKLAELVPGLRTQLSSAERRLTELDKKRLEAEGTAALVPGLREQLATAIKRVRELDTSMSLLQKDGDDAAKRLLASQKQLDTAKEEVGTLRRQLGEEQVGVGALKRQLADAEGRFAGIDMGGKRVVLLVDMSGSMGLSEGDKADPTKWPEVCKTVGQVLGSLAQAEKYQVILFSDSVSYPLGRPGEWLDFDRARTPLQVRDALLLIKPSGDTNLYQGFDAAFRMKLQGLDTIYLFSDGLPNTGPGLPTPRPKDDTAIAAALGKHLRDAINTQWNRGTPKVHIHAIGFFYESPSLGAFLWTLTRENGGSFVGMNRP